MFGRVRRAASALLIAAACLSSTACQPNKPTPPQLTPVRVSQAFQHLLYIALYVAKDDGLFRDEGLDVTISTAGGDAQAFAALTSGNVAFAQGDPAFVAIGNERGFEGRVVGMAVNRAAIWGVTNRSDIAPFKDPAGFKGRTVATYPAPNTSYVMQKELAQRANLELGKDVVIKQVQFGTEIATLSAHKVDIAQTIEPNVTQFERSGGKVVFSYPDAWGPLAFTGVMTSQKFIATRPDVVRHFMRAYERALVEIHTNRDRVVQIAMKRLPDLDEPTIRAALDRLVTSGSIPEHAAVEPASWSKLMEMRLKVGDLTSPPPANLVDNSFATAAIAANPH
jgi:NitT/TauT family transport system substrate-binding protein